MLLKFVLWVMFGVFFIFIASMENWSLTSLSVDFKSPGLLGEQFGSWVKPKD